MDSEQETYESIHPRKSDEWPDVLIIGVIWRDEERVRIVYKRGNDIFYSPLYLERQ